jgi:riboflavin kinase / FMN adenylyltransferase
LILKIINSLKQFSSKNDTIVTLGTFDGVHIGHKKIVFDLVNEAKKRHCDSLILTFFPHPRMVLKDDFEIKLLNTMQEKATLLEKTGLDYLVIHPFDTTFSELSAEEFVKNVLVDCFKIKKIIIGYDHRFGKNRTANIDDLVQLGNKYSFEVEQITKQEINEVAVSSTKIRNALIDGQILLANEFLGYNYFLSGTVEKGNQNGRTIGFPTANIKIEEQYKLIPKNGVYIVESTINNKTVFGIMNIGFNPTVGGTRQTIEVHFFDFDSELYGKKIEVAFLQRIRSEQKFDSLELLKNQLESDKKIALLFLQGTNKKR